MRSVKLMGAVLLAAAAAPAMAGVIVQTKTATFQSDLNNNVILTFDSFDTQGGTLILQSVRVDVRHAGGAILRADNDDTFRGATVNGRIIRAWTLTGPDAFAADNETVTTPTVNLGTDDGDGAAFDATGPDGTDFGSVSYGPDFSTTLNPNSALYATNGAGTVDFVADVLLMVNDLQFVIEPDVWQLEVQAPYLDVEVKLTYEFTVVPVPAGVWLAVFGLGVAGWIRKRVA
ncbi:MAG: hypothetical protein BroJett003_12590 [Planctomycetota bacterium]|nr:MAG: hypothetical protein BroJett003_12590 [Planctomycetota bacterium]